MGNLLYCFKLLSIQIFALVVFASGVLQNSGAQVANGSRTFRAMCSDVLVTDEAAILLLTEQGPARCDEDAATHNVLVKRFPGRKKKTFLRIFRDPDSKDHCLAVATLGANHAGGAIVYRVNLAGSGNAPEVLFETAKKVYPLDCYQNKQGDVFIASRRGRVFSISNGKLTELELPVPADARSDSIFREFRFAESSNGQTVIYNVTTDDPNRKQLRDLLVADDDGKFRRIDMSEHQISAACFRNADELLVTSDNKLLRVDTVTSAIYPREVSLPSYREKELEPEAVWRLNDGAIVGVFHQQYRSKWTYDVGQFHDGNFHQLAKLEKGQWDLLDATKDRQLYHDQFVIHEAKTGTWFSDAGSGLLNRSASGEFRRFDFRDGIRIGQIDRMIAGRNGYAWLVDTKRRVTQRLSLHAIHENQKQAASNWTSIHSRARVAIDQHGNVSLLSPDNGGEIVHYSGVEPRRIPLPDFDTFPMTGPIQLAVDLAGNHWVFVERDGSVAIHHNDRWTTYLADESSHESETEKAFVDALDGRFTNGSLPFNYRIGNELDKYMISFGDFRQIVWRNTAGRIGYFDGKKWNSPNSGREMRSQKVRRQPWFHNGDVTWDIGYGRTLRMPRDSWQSIRDVNAPRPWEKATVEDLQPKRQWKSSIRLAAQDSSAVGQDRATGFQGAAGYLFVVSHDRLSFRDQSQTWKHVALRDSPIFGVGSQVFATGQFEGALLDNHGRIFLEIRTPWIYRYAVFEPKFLEVVIDQRRVLNVESPFESIEPEWTVKVPKKTLLVRFKLDDRKWSKWNPAEVPLQIGGTRERGDHTLSIQIVSKEELVSAPTLTFPIKIDYEFSQFFQPLIAQLGAESFGEREEATEKLLLLGRDAIPGLQKLLKGDDAETAIRARTIMETLQSR